MKMEKTECAETSAQNSDAGESPKRNNKKFTKHRKFEIKKCYTADQIQVVTKKQ
jgi:hypothetical protein